MSDYRIAKIADFGHARMPPVPADGGGTIIYRAPEALLFEVVSGQPLDMWSLGCIGAHLLMGGCPFVCPAVEHNFQQLPTCSIGVLMRIFHVLGSPTEADWPNMTTFKHWSPHFPKCQPKPDHRLWSTAREHMGEFGEHFVRNCFVYDPACRATAEDVLSSPLFQLSGIQLRFLQCSQATVRDGELGDLASSACAQIAVAIGTSFLKDPKCLLGCDMDLKLQAQFSSSVALKDFWHFINKTFRGYAVFMNSEIIFIMRLRFFLHASSIYGSDLHIGF